MIIPARNAAPTIERAIRSVLLQDYRPLEIVVVDDGSTDATAALAGGFEAVRLIRLTRTQGAAQARNVGLDAARGAIVAFQDADDEWLQDKLSRQVTLLRGDARMVFVACGARLFEIGGRDCGPLFGGEIPQAGDAAWRRLLARNTIATPTVVAWRHALIALGGFDAALPVAEDQDMWIRLSLHGRLGYLDQFLVRVHHTEGSLSGVGGALGARQQIDITLPMIRRHLTALHDRLSRRDRRRILGERLCRVGRSAYSYGLLRAGLALSVQSMLSGYRPLETALFLLHASPAGRWLKQRLRR